MYAWGYTTGGGFSNICVSSCISQNTYQLRKNFHKWHSRKELIQFIKICCVNAINAHEPIVCVVASYLSNLSQSHWLFFLKRCAWSSVVTCRVLHLTQIFGAACFCMCYYGYFILWTTMKLYAKYLRTFPFVNTD